MHPPILQFLGAARTVTGSRFLVDASDQRVLVDCGMFQGLKEDRRRNWERFPVDPDTIDAVVLTHAHLDHCGYLPALVRDGFDGPIVCTKYTEQLASIVLRDSAHLHEEEANYANRIGYSKHHPAMPLYTVDDAERAISRFHVVDMDFAVEVADGIEAVLRPAGHILGAATVELRLNGLRRTLLFTGDLGRPTHPLLVAPADPPDADVVVTESTYGDRHHDDERDTLEVLAQAITRTAARGGMTIMPAFAVDRTEVMLMALSRLMEEGRIPHLPIYADSPMALSVLGVYRKALAEGDPGVRSDVGADPFSALDTLHEARSPEESKALNDLKVPSVIISASGMATGGRVLHHLNRCLPDPRNTVVLPGFQAPGTRGHSLAQGARTVKMLGRYVPVHAEILQLNAFSVHADQVELIDWLGRIPTPPDTCYMVHGDLEACEALADKVGSELEWPTAVPRSQEKVRLD